MIKNWDKKHTSIVGLTDYLETTLSSINVDSVARNVFFGSAGLFRMNRYLKLITIAIDNKLGDASGGDLRIVYETWIFSHLLLLSSYEEVRDIWAMTIRQNNKVAKALLVEIDYPDSIPSAKDDIGVEQRAKLLQNKLKADDPSNAGMPTQCYESIYRAESLFSTHASITSLSPYMDAEKGTIGVRNISDGYEWRLLIGGLITLYFAKRLFIAASMDISKLEEFDVELDTVFGSVINNNR